MECQVVPNMVVIKEKMPGRSPTRHNMLQSLSYRILSKKCYLNIVSAQYIDVKFPHH